MSFLESFRAARWIRTLNLLLQAVLILTLIAGLNYLALYYGWRFDLTKMHRHSLSAETKSYLSQLSKPVVIVVSFTQSEDPKYEQAAQDINDLLREYIYASETNPAAKISVQRLDVLARPRDAQQLGIEQHQVLVNSNGRSRVVRFDELYQFKEGKRTAFLGEQAITTAILDVASTNRKKIYFMVGHGELEPGDVSPERGLSAFTDRLTTSNFELEKLNLREKRKIPDDANLLIVPRPTTAYEPYEQELLRQYLSTRAGRVLLLLAPAASEFGLDDMMYDWGILADRAYIADKNPESKTDDGGLYLHSYDDKHPITKPLFEQHLSLNFRICRSIRVNPMRAADESLMVKPLIGVNKDTAWGERDFSQNPPRFDQGSDILGRFVSAAVASERVGAKAQLDFSVPRGRLVVIGSSDFITNRQLYASGNLNLALSAVNWLVDRDTAVNISPRAIEKFQLSLSQHELLRLRYSLLFALPGAFALLGLLVYWTRRR